MFFCFFALHANVYIDLSSKNVVIFKYFSYFSPPPASHLIIN